MATKRTYQPSKRKRQKACGFMHRKAQGSHTLKARRAKGRWRICLKAASHTSS